ncbi:hypothetical protein BH20CHL6_BH20CHL6_15630 [soil metagenome]
MASAAPSAARTTAPTLPPASTATPDATATPAPTATHDLATPDPSAEPTAVAPLSTHLAEAADFMPPKAQQLFFTDWSAIKRAIGEEDVTSQSPLEERIAVSAATIKPEAAPSGFGLRYLRTHADLWSFDTMDLAWEATIQGPPGFPTWVLRFREGFDLSPVAARFDQRAFSTERLEGAVLREHELDLSQDWVRGSELAITNTAFLDDGRTLVASSDPEAVRAVVAYALDPGAKTLPFLAVIESLEDASGAILLSGAGTCEFIAPIALEPDVLERVQEELAAAGPLSAYDALGVGYSSAWDPAGRIVFAYADPEAAAADLSGRASLADTGTSVRFARPYAESAFTLEATEHRATHEATGMGGSAVTLQVAPTNAMPRRLFDMVISRDMLFAACPP